MGRLVSMTMFGFTRKLIDGLERGFADFFAQPSESLQKGEFLLTDEVNKMISGGNVVLRVETTEAKWYGITYKEDLEQFVNAIKEMKQKGVYPQHLY